MIFDILKLVIPPIAGYENFSPVFVCASSCDRILTEPTCERGAPAGSRARLKKRGPYAPDIQKASGLPCTPDKMKGDKARGGKDF